MLLAGDVGGTKTLLGLFEHGERRPQPQSIRSYATSDFASFSDILDAFERDVAHPFTVEAAAAGVAGPVADARARLTNIAWDMSAAEIAIRLGTPHVRLLNNLEAMAMSVELLTSLELEVLHAGRPDPEGNAVVIAAGTGFNAASLHRVHGRLQALPAEAGHADFAARTEREIDLLRMLRARDGRASVEQVLSGPGLVSIHQLTHAGRPCTKVEPTDRDAPAALSHAAMAGTCARCVEALDLFVEAAGAEAGNIALRAKASAGVYLGGGIASKILPKLRDGRFMRAFLAKPPMTDLLTAMPVKVILNAEAGLIGAAATARELLQS